MANENAERELLEEATGWILKLEGAPQGSAIFEEFKVWLAACDEHRVAWERVNKTWTVLGTVKPAYNQKFWADVTPLSKRTRANTLLPTPAARAPVARKPYHRPVTTVVSALVAACVLWISIPGILIAMRADYRTAAGQTERVQISDGSVIDLGGSSAIKTDIGTEQRRVTLLAGEAFFNVVTDSTRPFIVDVQGAEVKVHGTAFDVQVSSTSTKVALLRGSIEASLATESASPPDILKPGEMFVVDHATGKISVESISLEDIGSWREGKIFLANASVRSAIELIQRYSSASILIPDRGLANLKVSGLFDLRNPDRALIGLVEPFGGKVRSVTPFLRIVSRL
ncbi:FecR family protein [Bradyrhizobium sp. STM 3562]|uniref:FecR family protein n=1 Tax=Bradyrhizobium sp. STM 3562 TaxID=578924 RepID=UPI0038910668